MGICGSRPSETLPLPTNPGEEVIRTVTSIRESFILIKSLGSGSFGNVFLVKDKRTGLERAAKELTKSNINERIAPEIYSELMVMKGLDHPGVLRLYEILETSTRVYIITEYLSGGQLFERLSRSPKVSEKLAAKYIFDLVLALSLCHKNGLIHRDIKPENLLFENDAPDAHLKMIDFCLSRLGISNEGSDQKAQVGSVNYMAPERFSGECTEKSDIWSVGVILHVVLLGKVPFQGKTDAETIRRIIERPLITTGKSWDTTSEEARSLIESMLNKNPAYRPTAQEILMHPWFYLYTKNTINENALHVESLTNLSKFHAKSKLEKSLFTFISSNISSKKDECKLGELFVKFDRNGDGTLSSAEINDGYDFIGTPPPPPVQDLLKKIGNTGMTIHYKDFLLHIQNWNKKVQFQELENSFKTYDKGGDGKLSLDELRAAIPGIEGSEWSSLLNEADLNGDGMITLDELKDYILTKMK